MLRYIMRNPKKFTTNTCSGEKTQIYSALAIKPLQNPYLKYLSSLIANINVSTKLLIKCCKQTSVNCHLLVSMISIKRKNSSKS